MSTYRAPTQDEVDELPFDFTDLEPYQFSDSLVTYAKFQGRNLVRINRNPWTYDDGDKEVFSAHSCEPFYPGITKVEVANWHTLEGFYQDKFVRWSRSQSKWIYKNHHPVAFTSEPPLEEEEAQVSEILERAEVALTTATTSLQRLTPDPTPEAGPSTSTRPATPTARPPPSVANPRLGFHPITVPVPPVPAAPMATATPKALGASPEAFDGKAEHAENFWSSLANYVHLNGTLFSSDSRMVSAALTYFKLGTPAGEWARDRQSTALALNPPDFGSWADFKKDFEAHFVPGETQLEAATLMHTYRMGSTPFNEWYQKWSTYAARANVDDNTKMFAFRRALPEALHAKILGVSPQPTTLAVLVERARDFDRLWRMYKAPAFGGRSARGANTRGATTREQNDSTSINYANLEAAPVMGRISKEEKDRRFKAKECFYCGKTGHMAKECRAKKNRAQQRPQQSRKDAKARALTTQDPDQKMDEDPSPSYDDHATVSRFYHDSTRADAISASSNEDF